MKSLKITIPLAKHTAKENLLPFTSATRAWAGSDESPGGAKKHPQIAPGDSVVGFAQIAGSLDIWLSA
jgi:hypothetical protein